MSLKDLFRPHWKHSNRLVRLAAVKGLEDETLLETIAREDPDEEVRQAAVRRIDSQEVLSQVAMTAVDRYVRKGAIERLTDEELLAAVGETASLPEEAEAVIERMSDQNLLARLARRARYGRAKAVERLEDQEVLADLARQDEDSWIRRKAVERLEDQALLAQIAETEEEWIVREAVVRRLNDQAVLARVAQADSFPGVREVAVGKVTDQEVLGRLAADDSASGIRLAAVQRLEDQGLLAQIARTDANDEVRQAAAGRVTNPELMAELAPPVEQATTHEYVVYKETKPDLGGMRDIVLDQMSDLLRMRMRILAADAEERPNLAKLRRLVTAYDNSCSSAIIGLEYEIGEDEDDDAFTAWAREKIFDREMSMFSGTWDLDYWNGTTVEGLESDFAVRGREALEVVESEPPSVESETEEDGASNASVGEEDGGAASMEDSDAGDEPSPDPYIRLYVEELKGALEAIRRHRSLGNDGTRQPLRPKGLMVLRFPKGRERSFDLHDELLARVEEEHADVMSRYRTIGIRMAADDELSGLVFVFGQSHDVREFAETVYFLPAAERFVAERCDNDWQLVNATSTESDVPAHDSWLDLDAAERGLQEILEVVKRFS